MFQNESRKRGMKRYTISICSVEDYLTVYDISIQLIFTKFTHVKRTQIIYKHFYHG